GLSHVRSTDDRHDRQRRGLVVQFVGEFGVEGVPVLLVVPHPVRRVVVQRDLLDPAVVHPVVLVHRCTPRVVSVSSISRASTSSKPRAVVSSTTASSAGRSGATARVESARPRRWTSASTPARSSTPPAATFCRLRRSARTAAEAVR